MTVSRLPRSAFLALICTLLVFAASTAQQLTVVQEKAPMHVHDFRLNAECNRINAVGHEQACVVEIV